MILAPDLTPARRRGTTRPSTTRPIMDTHLPEGAKELAQPQGISTQEVGVSRGNPRRDGYVLGTPERLRIARVVHEANRAWARANGDTSHPPFDEAPQWQVNSALVGIDKITLGEVGSPEQAHESWLADKQADGWVYGEVKNPKTKEHPCMVPYAQLPFEHRIKDHLFVAIVTTLTKDIG